MRKRHLKNGLIQQSTLHKNIEEVKYVSPCMKVLKRQGEIIYDVSGVALINVSYTALSYQLLKDNKLG